MIFFPLQGNGCNVLEVGCGCGNTVFPLMEENGNPFYFACDFSPRAVDFVKVIWFFHSSCKTSTKEPYGVELVIITQGSTGI